MSHDDWKRLEPLLDALLDTPVQRRAALLARLSDGDPERRARLEHLVADCERAYALLERPATDRFAALLRDPDPPMPEVLAGRYQPVRELGRGGMAVVYLARDLRHDRDVAVKVVHAELAATLGRERFLREIAIVAQLRHPHIVPLFDSGEADGSLFYVMPLIDGASVRERLRRDDALSVAQVVVILRDVCDALTHAHERGIVHRDIKPDNVLLSGRHAMVTDFGVARAVSAAAQEGMRTAAGVLLGTPAYMAPEQATGDPHVDHRADIYSLGVLAYELLAGRPPFPGDSVQDVVKAHLVQAPEPIAALRPDIPAPLADLVMTCLAKRPADRWSSADEVLGRLNGIATSVGAVISDERQVAPRARTTRPRWTGIAAALTLALSLFAGLWALAPSTPPAATSRSLAVLVFRHSGEADLESIAFGLTTSLIGALGSVASIDVRSLDAVWPYRDGLTAPDVVAQRLGVGWLLGGQVYRLADSVVVVVELSDAATGRARERLTATAAPGNEVALMDSLVPAVGGMLRERIGDRVRLEGWRAGTRSDAAFDAVSRAHRWVRDADYLLATSDIRSAFGYLRRADSALASASIAAPDWPEPLIERAWVARKLALSVFGTTGRRDSVARVLDRGIAFARSARRVAPEDRRAQEVRGVLLHARWLLAQPGNRSEATLDSAAHILSEATDADTSLARGLNVLSMIQFHRGQVEQARLTLTRAYAADAFAVDANQILSRLFNYSFVDQADVEARRWCTLYARSHPDEWFGGLCRLHLMTWDATETPSIDAAWQIAKTSASLAARTMEAVIAAQLEIAVAGVLARAGEADSARRVLARVAQRTREDDAIARFDLELQELEAGVRVKLGEPESAMRILADYLARNPERRASLSRDRRFKDLPIRNLPDAKPSGS